MQCKFMEESSHIRPPIKGLQGVGISASLWLPIELKPYWSREWKQIHEPGGRTCDTSKRSYSTDPLPWGQCGMAFHSHPSWNPSPIAFLVTVSSSISLPRPPAEEHMSPITVLLSQHTIKAERQTLLPGLYLYGHSCASLEFPAK